MALKLRGKEMRAALAKLRGHIVEGLDHQDICDELGLDWGEVDELKRKLLDEEAEVVRHKSTEHTYVEYCMEMRRCMSDLDKVVADYTKQKNVTGFVGAVRARAELLDRMIKTGQDFGLIERKAEGASFAAGEAIKNMANADLRKYIYSEINTFNTLIVKFGDQSILEMEPGPLYQTISTPKQPVRKTKGHARSKVLAGRRVVRGGAS